MQRHVFTGSEEIDPGLVAAFADRRSTHKDEGKLHTTALMEKSVSFSVSRVNERFLEVLFAGWIGTFVAAALTLMFPQLLNLGAFAASTIQIYIPLAAFGLGALWLIVGQKSRLRGRAYNRRTLEEGTGESAKESRNATAGLD